MRQAPCCQGVTVEAASPALLEKVRTAVTDGTGQYRIENLTPGTYTRDVLAAPASRPYARRASRSAAAQVITINADMRVGGVQETITVTGETPVVDVQTSTRTQKVIDNEVIAALPASRGYGNILATVPGIQATGLNSGANPVMNFFTARGGARQRRHGPDRRHERRLGVQRRRRGRLRLRHGERHGNPGHDRRRPRRDRSRRPGVQHDSAHRRQQLQRHLLPELRRRVGAVEQPRRRAAELRHQRSARARSRTATPTSRSAGRSSAIRLWFFGNARTLRISERRSGPLWQRERRQPERVHLRRGPQPEGAQRQLQDDRRDPPDGSADAQEQARLLLRLSEELHAARAFTKDGDQCRDRGDDWVALGAIGGFGSNSPEAGNQVWDDREKIVQAHVDVAR